MTGKLPALFLATSLGIGMVAGLALAPGAPAAVAQQSIIVDGQEIVLEPSQDLTNAELRLRIRVLRSFLRSGTRIIDGVRLRPIVRADRAELQARREGLASPNQGDDVADANAGDGDEDQIGDDDQPQVIVDAEPAPDKSQKSTKAIREILRDQRAPTELNDAELRQRIAVADQILETVTLSPRQKTRVEGFRNNDVAELNKRIESETGVDVEQKNPNQTARALLLDERAPADLKIKELRGRMSETRAVLAQPGLSKRNNAALRRLLASDRTVLRQRVAAREQAKKEAQQAQLERERELEAAKKRELTLRELLADRRPGRRLKRAALTERIESTRVALRRDDLTGREQRVLENMLADDRAELRSRLRKARETRRAKRKPIQVEIQITPRADRPKRGNIALAEAFDEEIEEQLVAAPTRRIERRYTVADLRAEPSLRQLMPGIEIDTVRFGTNEDFVREEEIPQLDGLGEIIERIVDANPDEVFVIEGHTDATGSAVYNQDLSERRAEAVRQALLDFFLIPEDSLEAIGYGEQFLKIPTLESEQENRRVTVRRITPLVR